MPLLLVARVVRQVLTDRLQYLGFYGVLNKIVNFFLVSRRQECLDDRA